jgi:hypothetical protein
VLDLGQAVGNQALLPVIGPGGTAAPPAHRPAPGPVGGTQPAPRPPQSTAHPPSLRVHILAHASPRWRSARMPKDADEENRRLSEQRALEVHTVVEDELREILGPSAHIDFDISPADISPADEDGRVTVTSESRGSRDTLKEARGDRSADEEWMRRVEVHIERTDRSTQHVGVSRPATTKVVRSQWWSVDLKSTHSVSGGAAATLLDMVLRNEDTGREAHVYVPTGGGSTPGLSTQASVGGDPVLFKTDVPMGFADFHNVPVRYTTLGFGLVFFGWEKAYLSFVGLGPDAQSLDVSGWNVGAQIKLGGGVTSGPLKFYGTGTPPTDTYAVPPSVDWVPYDSSTRTGDLYVARFATGMYRLTPKELNDLRSFVIDVGYRFRDE